MVIWNILLTIFVVLWSFGCVVERKRLRADLSNVALNLSKLVLLVAAHHKDHKEYTDQSVLAHEKMAHEGYENYTTEGKVIG